MGKKHRRLFENQDDCLINISEGRPPDQKALRSLPPWRAVLIARVAQEAMVITREEVEELVDEASKVGGAGKLSRPKEDEVKGSIPIRRML
jgi:hypothetical protein